MAVGMLVLVSCGKKENVADTAKEDASQISAAESKTDNQPADSSQTADAASATDIVTQNENDSFAAEGGNGNGENSPADENYDPADGVEGRIGEIELDDGGEYPLFYYDGLCYAVKDGEAFALDTVFSDNYLEEYSVREYVEDAGKKYPVTALYDNCFDGCSTAKSIRIPVGVKTIGNECFFGCDELTSIVIPDSVSRLGDSVFAECANLQTVKLPKNVESFGEGIFFNCDSLLACELPYNLTVVPKETFSGCTSITDIKIPVTVKTIGADAFWSCESLTKLCLPQGITVIEDGAFFDCCSLTKLCLPPALESFEPDFDYCDELTLVCTSKKFFEELTEYFEGTSVEVGNIDDPNGACASNCGCEICK